MECKGKLQSVSQENELIEGPEHKETSDIGQ
jgi:hypothetical protein